MEGRRLDLTNSNLVAFISNISTEIFNLRFHFCDVYVISFTD